MNPPIIETGLRAVDLFAPLPPGGDILVAGEAKSGGRVLGTELVFRLSRRAGNPPNVSVFLDGSVADADDYAAEFRQTFPDGPDLLVVDSVSTEALKARLVHRPFSLGNAVFAFSNDPSFIEGFLRAVKAGRESALFTKLTAFVVTEATVSNRFDARIATVRALAAEAVFPAIDARVSESNAAGLDRLAAEHGRVAKTAREALTRVMADLAPGSVNDEQWIYHTDPSKRPALQALLFLSQPFFCAEPYTGMPAAVVPLATTVDQFRDILAGRHARPRRFPFDSKTTCERNTAPGAAPASISRSSRNSR